MAALVGNVYGRRTNVMIAENSVPQKCPDTVGELKSAEMCVSHMPSWKAKTLGKLTQEEVLLEP